MARERCVPGSICHAPNDRPDPVFRALRSEFEFFITLAIVSLLVLKARRVAKCEGLVRNTGGSTRSVE